MKWQGKKGLIWFTGIVEDRDDPLFLNRVRVRIYGIHTHRKDLIATPDLPWSQVLMPVTSPSLSGLGTTTHGLVEGSTVMGFWRDGLGMQDSVIMGSFIGQPEKYSRKVINLIGGEEEITRTTTEGFNDPRLDSEASYKETPDGENPDHINRNYGLTLALDNSPRRDGESSGEIYPKESYIGSSDVNLLSRAEGKYDKDSYPNNKIEAGGLGKTLFTNEGMEGFDDRGDDEDRVSWVKPKYPFNHVYESESGHVIEIDDTPGYERINLFHRSGARIEINNKGEIHIIAAAGQDFNVQAANINCNSQGSGSLNISAECEVNINSKEATKIISKGPTDIISSGETKITSLKDVIMKAVKKIKIQ